MTRTELITLTGQIAKSLQNADTLDVFINEVFRDVSKLPKPPLVQSTIVALTAATDTYSFESDMLTIHHAIMDDSLLAHELEQSLDAYSTTQTTDTGTPVAITQDDITARTYRLYPIPDTTSDALIPAHGEPYGEDWPDNSLILIYADDRETSIPPIYALPFAFNALSREFMYPSDHTDIAFSTLCAAFSTLLATLTEIKDA